MQVIEFWQEAATPVRTHGWPITIDGWAVFHAAGDEATEPTIGGEIPSIDDSTAGRIRTMMEASAASGISSNPAATVKRGIRHSGRCSDHGPQLVQYAGHQED
jgi:hypothetical protein